MRITATSINTGTGLSHKSVNCGSCVAPAPIKTVLRFAHSVARRLKNLVSYPHVKSIGLRSQVFLTRRASRAPPALDSITSVKDGRSNLAILVFSGSV